MPVDKDTWPELLQRLAARYRVWRHERKRLAWCELFWIDLSEMRLRLSDATPLLWVKADAAEQRVPGELAELLIDMARQENWRRECIVLLDGPGAELKQLAGRQYFPRLLIIDRSDQQRMLAVASQATSAQSLTGAFLDLICDQIPLSSLAPYEISRAVSGSGFFGRQGEVDRILRQDSTNFAVLGIRRIGKTSLLTEVYRQLLLQGEGDRLVWLDCSKLDGPEQFVQQIVLSLNKKELPRLERRETYGYPYLLYDFLRRMPLLHGGPITLLLDEFDTLLEWDYESHNLLTTLRDAARELPSKELGRYRSVRERQREATMPGAKPHDMPQQCRLIIAGFRRLNQELHDPTSPFFLALEPIYVKPFSRSETEEMIVLPMHSLRVKLEDEKRITNQIYQDTRGHPRLVQYYCRELVDGLAQRGSRTIAPSNLLNIYQRESFRAYLLDAFRDGLETWEKILVYALLLEYGEGKESYQPQEMSQALERRDCPRSPDEIDRLCENLVWAGIFEREGQSCRFVLPVLPRMLRLNYNLEHNLAALRKGVTS